MIKNHSGETWISDIVLSVFLLSGIIMFNSCKPDPTVPILSTDAATDITVSTVTISGNVTDDGGAEVTARGICWGTASSPTMDDDFKPSGTGKGSFTCNIDGLEPNTLYYARAYAQNSVGVAYGNEIEFTTGVGSPEVTTSQVSGIYATTATCGGVILSDGGGSITEQGICWSTTTDPDLNDMHAAASIGSETFSCSMTSLSPGTKYYVRAYAKNSGWTVYGDQVTFNTKVVDIEGNLYSTVTIGSQVWMAENLKTTKFNDNTDIPYVTDDNEWINMSTSAYCWPRNEIQYKEIYGASYNWYTVNTGKLCPAGWHVPTDDEFKVLEQTLGMASDQLDLVQEWRGTNQGAQLKSAIGWAEGENGTNSSGFSALPGGYRFAQTGAFNGISVLSYWWTSSEYSAEYALYRRLDGTENGVFRYATLKEGGKYVRCLKNQ